jgi:hypothetical protein
MVYHSSHYYKKSPENRNKIQRFIRRLAPPS